MRRFMHIILLALFFVVVLAACTSNQLESGPLGDPELGAALFSQQQIGEAPGCASCHSVQADQVIVGPSLTGIGLRAENQVEGLTAEEYLHQSILEPDAYVVEGFAPGVMYQEFEDVLTDEQIYDLEAFLLTLE